MCERVVLYNLFNLRKLGLAFLWPRKNGKCDLIQIVLCLKGKRQNRCAGASDSAYGSMPYILRKEFYSFLSL